MPTHSNLYTSGRYLNTRAGSKLILRGINLPLLDDWSFPPSNYLAEIAKTNANAVRFQWYVDYGQAARPTYSINDLDPLLLSCAKSEMVPIVMLADLTCAGDTSQLNDLVERFLAQPDVVTVLKKHAAYLIFNIANEVGQYHWAGDSQTALDQYVSDYTAAIAKFRAAGLNFPLMIDAPDCGEALDVFLLVGEKLIAADPQHNVLLSAHAYWAGYDGMQYLQKCVNASLPIVLGEISNRQDDNPPTTYYSLDGSGAPVVPSNGFTYQALLGQAFHHEIGWLAWSWGPDDCTDRKLSTDGTFASLSAFGKDFISNLNYGLAKHSTRHKLM